MHSRPTAAIVLLAPARPLVPPTLSSYSSLSESAPACQLYFPRTSKSLSLSLLFNNGLASGKRTGGGLHAEELAFEAATCILARCKNFVAHFTQKSLL
jgi:hypothetical protein